MRVEVFYWEPERPSQICVGILHISISVKFPRETVQRWKTGKQSTDHRGKTYILRISWKKRPRERTVKNNTIREV